MPTDKSRFENSIRYEVVLEDGRTYEYWNESSSADNVSLSSTHVTGKNSISFDKTSGSVNALISRNPSSMVDLDLNMFALTGHIYIWIYLPSVDDISSVDFLLGTDSSNHFKWSYSSSTLAAGWNKIVLECTDSIQIGEGLNWYSVEYMAVSVVFNSSSDTLSGVCLDSITIQNPLHNYSIGGDINIENTGADHYEYVKLADVTNGIDNTYYYTFSARTFKFFGLQFILNGGSGTVTCTIEISAMDDVDEDNALYEDITPIFSCKEEFQTSAYVVADTPLPARYARVKVVVNTGGANDASWKVYLVKLY